MDSRDLHVPPHVTLSLAERLILRQWSAYLWHGGPKPETDNLAAHIGDPHPDGPSAPDGYIAVAQQETKMLLAKRWALRQLHALGHSVHAGRVRRGKPTK